MKFISSILSQRSLLLLALAAVTFLFSGCYVEERRVVNRGYYGRGYGNSGYYGGRGYRSTTVVRDRNVYVAPRRTSYIRRTPTRAVVVGRTNVVNRRNVNVVNTRRGSRDRDYDRRRRD